MYAKLNRGRKKGYLDIVINACQEKLYVYKDAIAMITSVAAYCLSTKKLKNNLDSSCLVIWKE